MPDPAAAPPPIRLATPADLAALKTLVESAYRGDAARAGWTHEADLLGGERIGRAALAAMLAARDQRVLVIADGAVLTGCVAVTAPAEARGHATLGMLCVAPGLQARGHGRRLIAAAETLARDSFAAPAIEMTVIAARGDLIPYYQRRGYTLTGERRPFPDPAITAFDMVVLARTLA